MLWNPFYMKTPIFIISLGFPGPSLLFYKVVFQWHYSSIKGLSKHTHLSKHHLIKCITSLAGTMLTSFSVFHKVLIYAEPQGQSVSHALRNGSAGARRRWQLHVEEQRCTKGCLFLSARFFFMHHSSVHRRHRSP